MDTIKAVLFDYDGVLGSEPRGIYTTSKYLAEKSGAEYQKILDAYLHFVDDLEVGRITEKEMWPEFCELAGVELDKKWLLAGFKASKLNKEMMDIAKKLKADGIKTGIITSNSKLRTDTLTTKHKLKDTFKPIVCGATVASAKAGKYASVDIFNAALKSLRLKPADCIFIDNTAANLEIPEAMGFHVYHHDAVLNDMLALRIYLSGFGLET